MRYKIVALFFFFVFCKITFAYDILEVRNLFYSSVENSSKANDFIMYLGKLSEKDNPEIKAYSGMGYMLLAKHAFNPYNKLANFNKGKELLETAISADPGNVELRFLRFSVQTNAPFFLGYSGKVQEDEKVIKLGYASIQDQDLRNRIRVFFKESNLTL